MIVVNLEEIEMIDSLTKIIRDRSKYYEFKDYK